MNVNFGEPGGALSMHPRFRHPLCFFRKSIADVSSHLVSSNLRSDLICHLIWDLPLWTSFPSLKVIFNHVHCFIPWLSEDNGFQCELILVKAVFCFFWVIKNVKYLEKESPAEVGLFGLRSKDWQRRNECNFFQILLWFFFEKDFWSNNKMV